MNDLNSIIIEGNLTQEPEMKYTTNGTALCSLSIAVNRYYKSGEETKQETAFLDVECWGRIAESCSRYLSKGRGIRIVGRLKQDRWEQDGYSRSKVIIVAENVEFKPARQQSKQEYAHA